MAEIVNERDVILQTAARRTVEIPPPAAVIIEGYTGITLLKDPTMFVAAYMTTNNPSAPGVSPIRMVLTAQLKGIPQNTPVTWEAGKYVSVPPPPGSPPGTPYTAEWQSGGTVILTNTGDPLVRTIEASNYPALAYPNRVYPTGAVRVSVEYGGQTFSAIQSIATFTG